MLVATGPMNCARVRVPLPTHNAPAPTREVGRHSAGAERPGRARALVHTGDRLVVGVEHPGRALPDCDARRRPAHVDRGLHADRSPRRAARASWRAARAPPPVHRRRRGRRPRRRRPARPRRAPRRGVGAGRAARGGRSAAAGLWSRERRVLLEDALVQRPQRLARLDPELVDEQPPPGGERLERLRLAARAVQREHQLAAQALAQRMLGDQRLELGDHLAVLDRSRAGPRRGPRSRRSAAPRGGGSVPARTPRCARSPEPARARGRARRRRRRPPAAAGPRRGGHGPAGSAARTATRRAGRAPRGRRSRVLP